MSHITFADVVHQTVSFSKDEQAEALVLDLIDTSWFQRLRDVAQTGSTSLVYMFSEHSRFGHSIGVAYLANHLMKKLAESSPLVIDQYRTAVSAAALLHDIGHIAPGSHTAFKTWFPNCKDCHEQFAAQIVLGQTEIRAVLENYDPKLPELVAAIINESSEIPPWTWQIVSGGGWNVDRGNWCIVDSVMAGVSYGRYNIAALLESIVISPNQNLALKENRLDAMMHFAVARHSMYRQLYQHRVLLASETINQAIAKRARLLGKDISFLDSHAAKVLSCSEPTELDLDTIFAMRESWWRYHLFKWTNDPDPILSDLARRVLNRKLLKTIRISSSHERDTLIAQAKAVVEECGFDSAYYLHEITTADVHTGDSKQAMPVLMDSAEIKSIGELEPLWNTLINESKKSAKSWLVLPEEAKRKLGRLR